MTSSVPPTPRANRGTAAADSGPSWSLRPDRNAIIAGFAVVGILAHLWLRWFVGAPVLVHQVPLYVVLVLGGGPLVVSLGLKAARGQFGSDLLAGLSIVTALLLGEFLAGAFVVLMLSGGEALEAFAVARARLHRNGNVLHDLW